jgi:predicted esterase
MKTRRDRPSACARGLVAAWAAVMVARGTALAGLLAVPDGYTPDRSWPVVVSTQNNPDPAVMKRTPFFLVHAGGQGVECMTRVEEALVDLAGRYNVDPLRVYATSFSRGGHEILLQASLYPHLYAAIAPVCNDLRHEPGMTQVEVIRTPTLFLHGTSDSFRETGRTLFERMKTAGCPIEYRTYPGGHSPEYAWNQDPQVWLTFFAGHVLNPYPTNISHRVPHKRYSRAYWVEAAVTRDAGDLKASFTAAVTGPNRIALTAGVDVAALDLYLAAPLVDVRRPVVVLLDGATAYEGPVMEKITVKVRDAETVIRGANRPLWERMAEAGRKAGFAREPVPLPPVVTPVPAPPAPDGAAAGAAGD